MTITGEKVVLRPIEMEDTDDILRWRNSQNVRKNFIYQEEFTREIHENWMRTKVATGLVIQFIIIEKSTGRKIGSTYLKNIDSKNKNAEFGIFIGEEDSYGKGYGSETAILMKQFTFHDLKLHKLYLRAFRRNAGAVKSYEKAGFQLEGIAREQVRGNEKFEDLVFMAILNEG